MHDGDDSIKTSAQHQCNHYRVTLGTDSTILFSNNHFSDRFLSPEFSQSAITMLLPEQEQHLFHANLNACIYSPGTWVYGTSTLKNKNDDLHPIKYEMVAAMQQNAGMAIYLVGHDVHDYKSDGSIAGHSRNILQAIFDSSDNVNFFISPAFKILFFNSKAYENGLKLHNREMKIGDSILDFLRDTRNQIDDTFLGDFAKATQGEIVVREAEVNYKNDFSMWLRSEYTPVYDNNKLSGISIAVSDITERNRYEENIRLQNEKLRKIAFIQSHQVRQPLSNMLGILSFLNTEGLSADDLYLMKILKLSATQLDSVVRNVVIEAQQIELYKEFSELKLNTQNI